MSDYNEKLSFSLVFNIIKVHNGILTVSGYVDSGSVPYTEYQLYYDTADGTRTPVTLTDTMFSYSSEQIKIADFGGFDFSVKLSDSGKLSFVLDFAGTSVTPHINFDYRCVVNNTRRKAVCGNHIVETLPGSCCLTFRKADMFSRMKVALQADIIAFRENKSALVYRLASKLLRSGEIWIYCDRDNLTDNAYYQFIHDSEIKDGVRRYYVVKSLKNADKLFTPEQRKNLLIFRSFRHKILFINASKILTSFNSATIISPHGDKPLKWYYDLIDMDIIYLQHGVLHANLPFMYAKEKSNVDKVVISSDFERKNFCENYRFKEEELLYSGMPRFDTIDITTPAKKKILFSPSWRKNLIGEYIDNKRELYVDKFLDSPFYKEINKFLNSKELADLLEKYDLTLDFKNHPIFSEYDSYIKADNPRINVTQEGINMQDYLTMITDYSSVVFDFVYLNRPIIYFVPDYDEFCQGLTHSYSKLDLPLEEGFGDITLNSEDLLNSLRKLAENDFKTAPVYKKRTDDFFGERTTTHRDRLYELVK